MAEGSLVIPFCNPVFLCQDGRHWYPGVHDWPVPGRALATVCKGQI